MQNQTNYWGFIREFTIKFFFLIDVNFHCLNEYGRERFTHNKRGAAVQTNKMLSSPFDPSQNVYNIII